MPHMLIVGRTMTGKTTLATQLAQKIKGNRPLIILDPNLDPRWGVREGVDFITHDRDAFLQVVKDPENAGAVVCVDESGETIGKYGGDMAWLATRGRHFGYQCIFIGQRANHIDKNVRTQCAHIFIFRLGQSDAALMAEEYADPSGLLKDAPNLGKGEYLAMVGLNPPQKMRLTF